MELPTQIEVLCGYRLVPMLAAPVSYAAERSPMGFPWRDFPQYQVNPSMSKRSTDGPGGLPK